jgi:dTDP-4-amino-4,6-dideoxygalactose transaminase
VLQDGTWCDYTGWAIEELKHQLASRFQHKFVQLCSSGTVATEIALRGQRIGADDEVILAGYDFPGNFRAIESIGAQAVLIDVQVGRWIVDVEAIENACSPRTKAIVVSHLHGQNLPMRKLMEIAGRLGLIVVEDCCQAPGAIVDARPAGSWGDCTTLSFGGSKLLTSGRGGAVLCSDPRVAQRIAVFCERGNDAFALSQLQAAALLPQLSELDDWNQKRSDVVLQLAAQFGNRYSWLAGIENDQLENRVFYKWPLLLEKVDDPEASARFRVFAIQCLNAHAIPAGPGFHGFYRRLSKRARSGSGLGNVIRAADSTVLVQHHALLMDGIVEKLETAFTEIDEYWNENFSNQ